VNRGPRVTEVRAQSAAKLAQVLTQKVEHLRRDTPGPVLVVYGGEGASVWAEDPAEPPSRRENAR